MSHLKSINVDVCSCACACVGMCIRVCVYYVSDTTVSLILGRGVFMSRLSWESSCY